MTKATERRRWHQVWAALLGVLLLVGASAAPAGGAAPRPAPKPKAAPRAVEPLSITYVARDCPQYTDVMANKARNNIQESLRDLGPDSNYASAEAVSAQKEAAGSPLPPCEPLPGWTFSTGTGYTGPTGASQNLSTVTGALRQDITTQASTPELDAQGQPTGRTLDGAVTVQLNADEIAAVNRNVLTVQGGTPAQPLNGLQEQYGFAALRCSNDALNGDNVENLRFPNGARHVFCYYYAITPPPGAGTIKVVKHIDGAGQGDFRFDGNISYADTNGDGTNDFVLSAANGNDASQTFVRGESTLADDPWTFKEVVPAGGGWQPPYTADCTAAKPGGGAGESQISTDPSGQTRIGLTAGETVTCVYTNRRSAGEGLLQKESLGGTGTFHIELDEPPNAPPVTFDPDVTTQQEGVPVTVAEAQSTATGTYTVRERRPAADGRGTWELTSAVCGGEAQTIVPTDEGWTVSHEVTAGENPKCLLTNTFTPGGAISVEKVSKGGTASFGYTVIPHPVVTGPADGGSPYEGTATTTAQDTVTPALRRDGSSGPLADQLQVDDSVRYTVQEHLPPATAAGRWQVTEADCQGAETSELNQGTGSIEVALTPGNPTPTCRFTNTFVPAGTLDVVKTTSGDEDLRPGAAELSVDCADGTEASGEVAPGETGGSLPRQSFTSATTCTVTEPETGAAEGVDVTTTATLTVGDGDPVPVELGDSFPVRPGQQAVVRVANTFTEPGTLDVIKTTSGDEDLRPGAAELSVDCADGTEASGEVAPGQSGDSLPRQSFTSATTCTVTEPETGAAEGVDVTTTATLGVDGADPVPVELGDSFPVRPGRTTVVRVTNTFTAPSPSPTPTPTPTPTHPGPHPTDPGPYPTHPGGHPHHPGGQLPDTGGDDAWLVPTLALAGLMLLAGGVLARTAAVRRRNNLFRKD